MSLRAGLVGGALSVCLSVSCAAAGEFGIGGIQIWNPGHWRTTSLGDFYGPNYESDKMKPIELAGCRNAVFSGYIIVTNSIEPMEGLKATASDLVAEGGAKILAKNIRVRYASRAAAAHSWAPPYRFDRLLDDPPEELDMVDLKSHRKWRPKKAGPVAMQPIWITVRVPRDAKAGVYTGKLSVKADEQKTKSVAIRLSVAGFALPDPAKFRIQNVALQSQEAVGKHYRVKMWGEKHLEHMSGSLKLLGEINSRQLAMNLCVDFYGLSGNDESMVRWIKQPDGSFKHDFEPFDKYLDVAAKVMKKPNLIRLNCWGEIDKKTGKLKETGKYVSLLDPESGKVTNMAQPMLGTEESYKFWKPVLEKALAKLKARGWLDVTAYGHNSYCWVVRPKIVDVAHRIWPKGQWAWTSHSGRMGGSFKGTKPEIRMPIPWPDHIWAPGPGAKDPQYRGYRTLFKKRPGFIFHTMRGMFRATSDLWTLRSLVSRNIRQGHDGVSDFGADFFPIVNPKRRGRYYCLGNGRGTGGPNCSTRALIAPGPKGPVATERYEAFREGLQLCETVLYVQKGIDAGKLSAKLLKRAEDCLNERAQRLKAAHKKTGYDTKLIGEDSVKRERELFEVAAEVAKALK